MPDLTLGRHGVALSLLVTGSIALVGAQQLLGTVADAQTTEAIVDAHNLQRLPELDAQVTVSKMNAAVSTGQFEDLVKPTPVPTVAPTLVPANVVTIAPMPAPAPQPLSVFQSGIASTYGEGDGFEGNLTACGQVFRTSVVQVAHKTLPCGTMIRIEDTDTGMTVEAEVTDRGPYIPGRIVDLSWGAFSQLDATAPGLLHVNVYVLARQPLRAR
jgi:rare lipoprotein A (peptidoglycan hydrolase)